MRGPAIRIAWLMLALGAVVLMAHLFRYDLGPSVQGAEIGGVWRLDRWNGGVCIVPNRIQERTDDSSRRPIPGFPPVCGP